MDFNFNRVDQLFEEFVSTFSKEEWQKCCHSSCSPLCLAGFERYFIEKEPVLQGDSESEITSESRSSVHLDRLVFKFCAGVGCFDPHRSTFFLDLPIFDFQRGEEHFLKA